LFHVILADVQQTSLGTPPDTGFFGHPRGLSTLFFTEMWGALQLLRHARLPHLLHGRASDSGRTGLLGCDAASIYGTYYRQRMGPGDSRRLVADRFLGQYRSVLIGGIIIALGHSNAGVSARARSSMPASHSWRPAPAC
jgi:POT family proton-dependent oligopeptide transporter